ncbi:MULTISPECIES: fused DSP-PTPase phosphatase/NAD kinase-like protein [Winogradskyella]|uniref:phosphatase domain-containing putative toxin n=1 Tax=Winogradskyella TaxID=286104 RepID=UPI0015CCE06E|nr:MULTISPECIES: dual specificity protein phosphatase family protein [Winogradskyella]QXP79051.1 dual specificity protein phosphatase family protein [Winogradskyella sp. HaHa_3_26]
MKRTTIFIMFYLSAISFNYAQEVALKQIESKHFKNLYKVNSVLYRSEQPSKKGFKDIDSIGVKTILNLRRRWNNKKKAKDFNFNLVHQPIKTKALNKDDILNALLVIQNSEQPVLVHCWHGSDRTGTIIAAYRMVVENWSKELAIEEFQNDNLGYHFKMYPHLLILLKNLDVEKLQNRLNDAVDETKKPDE